MISSLQLLCSKKKNSFDSHMKSAKDINMKYIIDYHTVTIKNISASKKTQRFLSESSEL